MEYPKTALRSFKGIITKIEEKIAGMAPAIMGLVMTAGIVGSYALGGASAADTNAIAAVKYYGLSTMQWTITSMALIFGGATVFLRDFRTAIIVVSSIKGTWTQAF